MTFHLADAVMLSDRRSTRDGYVVASARAARTGIQIYAGREVGKPELQTVRVYRPETEVFSRDSLASYAHKPITNDHPDEAVTADNWKQHSVGTVSGEIARDGEFVRIPLMLADATAIASLDSGKRELSVGYACDLDWTPGKTDSGEVFDARQTNIRVNHVALVDRGRAGADCRIGDTGGDQTSSRNLSREDAPQMRKLMIDGITVELSDTAHEVVSKLQAQVGTLVSDNLGFKAQITAKDAELGAKDGEIAALKASALTDAQIDALVNERATVTASAKTIAPTLDTAGKSAADIRRAAVSAKIGDAKVAGKSDDYVLALFDSLVATAAPAADPVTQAIADGAPRTVTIDTAYAAMCNGLQDAWKLSNQKGA